MIRMFEKGNKSKIQTYAHAEAFIMEALPMFQRVGKKAVGTFNLEATHDFLNYLENPHKSFKSIHIAGTNGKGSVAHMLSGVYQNSGYKTGLFTSPHLITYRERIKINGKYIPEFYVLQWVQKHHKYLDSNALSFFEMSFGLACSYFSEESVDIALIEVGLGGRLDATNIICPILSVVTNIDYDHQDLLGNSLELIANEKAGIVKHGVPILLGNVKPDLYSVFKDKADQMNSELYLSEDSYIQSSEKSSDGIYYHLKPDTLPADSIFLPVHAPYHKFNLNTVLHALKLLEKMNCFSYQKVQTKSGLENFIRLSQFRGRYEIINHNPLIIADAAHNPGGLRFLNPLFKNKTVHLHIVLGLVKGKDLEEIFSLLPHHATYYFCAADVPRAMDATTLQKQAIKFGLEGEVWPSPKQAINEIILNADQGDVGLVIGSIYLIAEIL